jgi:hypothetical protein
VGNSWDDNNWAMGSKDNNSGGREEKEKEKDI